MCSKEIERECQAGNSNGTVCERILLDCGEMFNHATPEVGMEYDLFSVVADRLQGALGSYKSFNPAVLIKGHCHGSTRSDMADGEHLSDPVAGMTDLHPDLETDRCDDGLFLPVEQTRRGGE